MKPHWYKGRAELGADGDVQLELHRNDSGEFVATLTSTATLDLYECNAKQAKKRAERAAHVMLDAVVRAERAAD